MVKNGKKIYKMSVFLYVQLLRKHEPENPKTKYTVIVFRFQGVHRNIKFLPEVTGNGGCNENVKYKLGRRKSCNSSNESLHQGEKKS